MKTSVNDVKSLAGPEKAAIVLLALGEDHTAIWEALDDEEIKEMSAAGWASAMDYEKDEKS